MSQSFPYITPLSISRRAHGRSSTKRAGRSRAELAAEGGTEESGDGGKDVHGIAIKSPPSGKEHQYQNGSAESGEAEEEGVAGLVSVVKESPLQGKWFADLFEWALGTSAVNS